MENYQKVYNSPPVKVNPRTVKRVIIGIIFLFILVVASTMIYTIQEQEHAVILTFGKFTEEKVDAGLHIKAPYPIQEVIKVPAKLTQKIEIGFRSIRDGYTIVDEEALMITGDENIVHADAIVEWRIGNAKNYLYNISNGEEFLRNATIAAIRSVIGSTNLDYAITEGKTEIEANATALLLELQELYESGIHVIALRFQDIEPPEGEVQQAFKDVTDAREEQNTKVNIARRYANERIPVARGEAQALLEAAEAIKQGRIFSATGDVAKFNAIYTEYLNNPVVTEYRLVIETLERIYPNAKIFITNENGDIVPYLPLNELVKNTQGGE
ncbi:MAG: FtsH protease activity modulator HflK [Bacteroidales bacterium]